VPSLNLSELSQYFRSRMVAFFLKRTLLNERLARNMLGWTHSGFSVDLTVKIPPPPPRRARPSRSTSRALPFPSSFRTNSRLFPATEFLAELLQHLPDAGATLIRRYGLYSLRSRGTWSRKPHLLRLAPEGCKEQHPQQSTVRLGEAHQDKPHLSMSAKESRAAWARLLAKVYEVDPLRCSRCGS